ncbi:hypothetical protein LY76DRAFT_210973 [Colletotrichum caudatum]|nr:hypothetical protein LY76DRAFT_210973 [Colletotrichum caudatum]
MPGSTPTTTAKVLGIDTLYMPCRRPMRVVWKQSREVVWLSTGSRTKPNKPASACSPVTRLSIGPGRDDWAMRVLHARGLIRIQVPPREPVRIGNLLLTSVAYYATFTGTMRDVYVAFRCYWMRGGRDSGRVVMLLNSFIIIPTDMKSCTGTWPVLGW